MGNRFADVVAYTGVICALLCAGYFIWHLFYLLPTARSGTVYAAGYSRRAFRQVKPGMRKPQVLALLGRPLEKTWVEFERPKRVREDCWVYSKHKPGGAWWIETQVHFDESTGMVSRKWFAFSKD